MYHSIHAYQSTESIEHHSENGIKYAYHQARFITSLNVLSLKGEYNNVSVNESYERESAEGGGGR